MYIYSHSLCMQNFQNPSHLSSPHSPLFILTCHFTTIDLRCVLLYLFLSQQATSIDFLCCHCCPSPSLSSVTSCHLLEVTHFSCGSSTYLTYKSISFNIFYKLNCVINFFPFKFLQVPFLYLRKEPYENWH